MRTYEEKITKKILTITEKMAAIDKRMAANTKGKIAITKRVMAIVLIFVIMTTAAGCSLIPIGRLSEDDRKNSESSTDGDKITSIRAYPESIEMEEGDSHDITIVTSPSDIGKNDILWVSSNESVATVSSAGKVKAKGEGTCTITAASSNSEVSADVEIKVTSDDPQDDTDDSDDSNSGTYGGTSGYASNSGTYGGTSGYASNTGGKYAHEFHDHPEHYIGMYQEKNAASVYPAYYLSESEVSSMSAEEIQFVINQIYAKNGYIFKKTNLKNYFNAQPWYRGTISDMGSVSFSSMDKANLNLLTSYRSKSSSNVSGLGTIWTYYYVQNKLSASDVSSFSKYDIQLLINTIYAKNGYIFETDSLQTLFGAQSWYHGVTSDMSAVSFSTTDESNLNLLVKYR